MLELNSPLISPAELNDLKSQQEVIILDASMSADAASGTIPGAQFMHLKTYFADTKSVLPNTFPTTEQAIQACQSLGIQEHSTVVLYDREGIKYSPRAWFLLKSFGIENVYVLNGGLPAWIKAKLEVAHSYIEVEGQQDAPQLTKDHIAIVDIEDIIAHTHSPKYCLVDVRSSGRYQGLASEPRPQLQSGSIPHSINMPYQEFLEGGRYKDIEQLKKLFAEINPEDHLVFSCGSGVTACIGYFAAELALPNSKSIFDGSWTEWATRNGLFK